MRITEKISYVPRRWVLLDCQILDSLGYGRVGATKSPRMNPDLGSGRSISYEAQFKHAMLQMETGRKIADSPVLRDKLGISRGNVPDGEWTLPGIYKKIISRDTKLAVGRELTRSNLFPYP